MLNSRIKAELRSLISSQSNITVLTGAGVSAESGIPTFRGPEGYWTVGSENYQFQEISTFRMFQFQPKEVWKWFLFRRSVCQRALPNPGHLALVEIAGRLQDKFTLITQNVDGLHLRAGNKLENTHQIHGNLNYMRCAAECCDEIYPVPEEIPFIEREEKLEAKYWDLLSCPHCKSMTRPHVLLWDETYNEPFYRYESAMRAALTTDLLIIIGTTGAANLPNQIAHVVFRQQGYIWDINIEHNHFSEIAERSNGFFIQAESGSALPEIAAAIKAALND